MQHVIINNHSCGDRAYYQKLKIPFMHYALSKYLDDDDWEEWERWWGWLLILLRSSVL